MIYVYKLMIIIQIHFCKIHMFWRSLLVYLYSQTVSIWCLCMCIYDCWYIYIYIRAEQYFGGNCTQLYITPLCFQTSAFYNFLVVVSGHDTLVRVLKNDISTDCLGPKEFYEAAAGSKWTVPCAACCDLSKFGRFYFRRCEFGRGSQGVDDWRIRWSFGIWRIGW